MRKILPIFLLILLSYNIASAIPQKISFQGVLKDASGGLVTGNKNITFSIYDAAIGGAIFGMRPEQYRWSQVFIR